MSGDERLSNLRDEAEESMEPLLAAKRPAALARYLELSEIVNEEVVKAVDPEDLKRRFAPWSSFRGVEAELAELCVTGKR